MGERNPLTEEDFNALAKDAKIYDKEGKELLPRPTGFKDGLYNSPVEGAEASADKDDKSDEDDKSDAVATQVQSTKTTAQASVGELVNLLKETNKATKSEIINAFDQELNELKKKNLNDSETGAEEGGRRRTKRKGRKGSRKSKKGSKKSKKGAKKSKKGGRSRKNRRKYSRRRKH